MQLMNDCLSGSFDSCQRVYSRDAGKGGAGGGIAPLPFSKGGRGGAKVPLDKNSNPKHMRYND